MDRQIKKQLLLLGIEAVFVIVFCTLGLTINPVFILFAVAAWLGFETYRMWIRPGGSW